MVSASTPSGNEPAQDLILVHTVASVVLFQLRGGMVSYVQVLATTVHKTKYLDPYH